jgi:hypothetical protein
MAMQINQFSNATNVPQNGVRTTVWQLSGTPEAGQVISWGVYAVQLTQTVGAQSLDTIGSLMVSATNNKTVAQWKSGDPNAYGSWTQGNPIGFKPYASYSSSTNRLTITLNNGNQFGMGVSAVPNTATPTATPAPTLIPWTPTPQPTSTPIPLSTELMYISASNIGSGTQGIATIWADACGDEGQPAGTLLYSATGNPWNNQNSIPGGISSFSINQVNTGIGIIVPAGTQEVWIQTTSTQCPSCHGPYYTGLSTNTPTPTPIPTSPPNPTNTPLPTNTPFPTVAPMVNYRIEDCVNGYSYNAPKGVWCISGTLQLDPNYTPYEIGDVVQLKMATNATDCNFGATFCGTISSTTYNSSNENTDAMITRFAPTTCVNSNHCAN